ncbi:Uma2 family endonuclease [Micromonospora echinospora]
MTAALQNDDPPEGGWTTDDLDALPDDGRRRELLDGVLLVSPLPHPAPPDRRRPPHGRARRSVSRRVRRDPGRGGQAQPDPVLHPGRAGHHRRGRRRQPAHHAPHQVVLAVEIVSPSPRSIDRVLKPALYAQAGIPYCWRVEVEDEAIVVYTSRIDPVDEVYTETGRWTKVVDTGEPFPVNLPIARITPRGR